MQTRDALNSNTLNFDYAGLPSTGFVRLKQILGDKKANPPTPPIIPVSPASWWNGIRDGIYPAGKKISVNITVWAVEDIRDLIERINNKEAV
jgi:prophage regulatory protein